MATGYSRRDFLKRSAAVGVIAVSGILAACQAAATPAPSASGAPPTAAPTTAAETTLQRIKREQVVSVGFINEPPYNFATSEKLTGAYPEMLRAFFATVDPNIKMNGVLTEFSALIPGLVAKRFDINGGGMNVTQPRCQQIAFGNPEVQALEVFIVKKGNPKNLHSYKDVASGDAKYGAVTGGVEVDLANVAGIPKDRQVLFPDGPTMIAGLQAGRVDVVALTSLSATDLVKKTNDPNLELVAPLSEIPAGTDGKPYIGYVGVGFRKEDTDLIAAFDAWQGQQKQNGGLLKIMAPFGFTQIDMAPADPTAAKICAG